jgi:hypothetical protein
MTYNKLVNGEIVPMSQSEIAARQTEEAAWKTVKITDHITEYGSKFEQGPFTFNGFTEDGMEEHRRNAKETIDFLRELGDAAPKTIPWNSPAHGVQVITLDTLLGWLMGVGERRFKRFAAQTALKSDADKYKTTTEVESAFKEVYETIKAVKK